MPRSLSEEPRKTRLCVCAALPVAGYALCSITVKPFPAIIKGLYQEQLNELPNFSSLDVTDSKGKFILLKSTFALACCIKHKSSLCVSPKALQVAPRNSGTHNDFRVLDVPWSRRRPCSRR